MKALRAALFAAFAAVVLAAAAAHAVQPDEVMKDPALEARARALSSELRCMVCQNQSIDDSDASLARDIRLLIRDRIAKGESNETVRAFLVSRYGAFILLKPPLERETLLLWLSAGAGSRARRVAAQIPSAPSASVSGPLSHSSTVASSNGGFSRMKLP